MIGTRIRQARLASGLTLDAVAQKMAEAGQPITKAGLSKYERNKSTPGQAFLVKLGRTLGVNTSYFLTEESVDIVWIAFRRLAKMPQKKQEQVRAFARHVVEGQLWLQRTLFPEQRPNFPSAVKACVPDDAEHAAVRLRTAWGLDDSPIDSLTATVEDNGGVVVPCGDISDDFDGLAGRASGFPVAVVSMQVPDDRRRYNLAHELGHLVMDCKSVEPKEEEKLANRFASALLIPPSIARKELGSKRRRIEVKELGLLKRKYGLSMQGWARRAFDLGIIESGPFKSLCITFSKHRWRRAEPYHFVGNERPTKLKQMTLRAYAEGIISGDRAEQFCPGSTAEIGTMETRRSFSAADLRKMPLAQRQALLAAAAEIAQDEYVTNRQLTDFEAFSEDDLHDTHGEPDQR